MEMTVKHSLTRHMICLVSGSGKSVSDSVVLFQKSRPGYWNSLTVFQLCGRNKGLPPTSQEVDKNNSIYYHKAFGEKTVFNLTNSEEGQSAGANSLTSSRQLQTPQDLLEKIENSINVTHHHMSTSTIESKENSWDFTKTACIQVCFKYNLTLMLFRSFI